MRTSVDEPKKSSLIPEKVTYSPLLFSIYATVGHNGMRTFNSVVLSVITAPHNVPTPHISKTHLPIVSLNVRKVEFD